MQAACDIAISPRESARIPREKKEKKEDKMIDGVIAAVFLTPCVAIWAAMYWGKV